MYGGSSTEGRVNMEVGGTINGMRVSDVRTHWCSRGTEANTTL